MEGVGNRHTHPIGRAAWCFTYSTYWHQGSEPVHLPSKPPQLSSKFDLSCPIKWWLPPATAHMSPTTPIAYKTHWPSVTGQDGMGFTPPGTLFSPPECLRHSQSQGLVLQEAINHPQCPKLPVTRAPTKLFWSPGPMVGLGYGEAKAIINSQRSQGWSLQKEA